MNNAKIEFDNFCFWPYIKDNKPKTFMVACKDREYTLDERWVITSLTPDETKQLYEYLKQHFESH